MAYIVSARKYRPLTFEDVVGQDQITNTLKRAIESDHLAQAFLFCGPRGVGKTTCARILAKAVNTGKTEKLHEIDEDFSFNIFELDAASNNKVDDMHQLMAQVRIPPQTGKYKIYIIDEVHMLSQAAFNAFLKTLEEPPPYAIFILATTEKHKILPTILSRCQIYDFRRISVPDIVKHLQGIAAQENITAADDALHIIAEKADGALRDALSIFDRLVSYAGDNLTYEAAVKALNVLDYDYFFKLIDFLSIEDISSSFLLLNEVMELGFEGDHFVNGLSAHLRNLLVCKDEKTIQLLEVSDSLKERYKKQASLIPTNFIINALSLASEADVQYKQSQNKRLLVELMLMKIGMISNLINPSKIASSNTSQEKKTLDQIVMKPRGIENIEFLKNDEFENDDLPNEIEAETPEVIASKTKEISTEKTPETKKKKAGFGFDLDDLEKEVEEELKEKEKQAVTEDHTCYVEDKVEQNSTENIQLTKEILDPVWEKLLNWFKESEQQNLYETLNDHKPTVKENGIVLTLDSSVEKSFVENNMALLKGFLKRNIDGFGDILLNVTKSTKSKKIILNERDKFDKLAKKNPLLLKLKDELGLELEL
ncbi:MAG: DNA polymerase III subunit gamma/tau [Chitinophagales bacterium]